MINRSFRLLSSRLQFVKSFKQRPFKFQVSALSITLLMKSTGYAETINVDYSMRLSDWLLKEIQVRQEHKEPDIFLPGVRWNSPSEVAKQTEQKTALLAKLETMVNERHRDNAIRKLYARVRSLPVTGRVLLPEQDPRWLQLNPKLDPVLNSPHDVVASSMPLTVSVLREDGSVCTVPHQHGAESQYYVTLCLKKGEHVDWAWLIQANGEVQWVGVASWSASKQDEPSPGAWIWAPSRQSEWPEEVSFALANFLATQGPSGMPEVEKLFGVGQEQVLSVSDQPLTEDQKQQGRDLQPTASDWGTIGLLQTPTARMEKAGYLAFSYSNVYPYTRGNVILQPFDWFEFGFRYTSISNVLYGPVAFSGNQNDVDKSIDATLRLLQESVYKPELALGFRDLAGTGKFSSEYLVASKRAGNFDWNLGVGWGYLGSADNLKNPLSLISSKFKTRKNDVGQGGNFSVSSYFHGPAALFGGVQYQTRWEPLILKLELDGNNYKSDPGKNISRSSPFNLGAVYRWTPNIDLSVGLERGNTAMLGFTLHERMGRYSSPKISMPRPVPVEYKIIGETNPVEQDISSAGALSATASSGRPDSNEKSLSYVTNTISDLQKQSNWHIREIRQEGAVWYVTVLQSDGFHADGYMKERLDRMIAVLHRDAPVNIATFRIRYESNDVVMAEYCIDREAWMLQKTSLLGPSPQKKPIVLESTDVGTSAGKVGSASSIRIAENPAKRVGGGLGVVYSQTLGGPDGFLFYNIAAEASAKVKLWEGAFVSGALDARLIDNYDRFNTGTTSYLPRVRTYLRDYLTTSRYTIPNLQATQIVRLGENQFASLYGGELETMFAGVGGEYLWRPANSRLAIGVDVNKVQQRKFDQKFDLMDYKVTTGHVTAYWDTGWQHLLATVSVGQYLAGDRGVTMDVRKVFKNGVTMGAFITKTNVSSQQFGEGSFNKGIYITFPFNMLTTSYTDMKGTALWVPLTRDGGAKLNRAVNLYDYTSARDPNVLEYGSE